MPFKSKAQQGFINAAASRGQIPQGVATEMNAKSKGKMKGKPMHVNDAPLGYRGKLKMDTDNDGE